MDACERPRTSLEPTSCLFCDLWGSHTRQTNDESQLFHHAAENLRQIAIQSIQVDKKWLDIHQVKDIDEKEDHSQSLCETGVSTLGNNQEADSVQKRHATRDYAYRLHSQESGLTANLSKADYPSAKAAGGRGKISYLDQQRIRQYQDASGVSEEETGSLWRSNIISPAMAETFGRQSQQPANEDDGDPKDDTHVCRVLRSYYAEKGRPIPWWLREQDAMIKKGKGIQLGEKQLRRRTKDP